MFNVDDILAELAAGKSIEGIAQNAADVLNAAKAQHDKEIEMKKAAEEKARKEREAAAQKTRQREWLKKMAENFLDYIDTFYPGSRLTEDSDAYLNDDAALNELVDAIDGAMKEFTRLQDVFKDGVPYSISMSIGDQAKESTVNKVSDDAIAKFLKDNHLF